MFETTPHQWSQKVGALYLKRPGANTPEDEKKLNDALHTLYQRPSSGRTTRLGRKVEKPGDASPAGPSGQRDMAKHDGKHTNK